MASISLQRSAPVELRLHGPKGRGVFATDAIPSRQILDISPVLLFSPAEVPRLMATSLAHYTYNWPYRDPTYKEEQTEKVDEDVDIIGDIDDRGKCTAASKSLSLDSQGKAATSSPSIGEVSLNPPQKAPSVPSQALALGLGSLFNHARDPNVGFRRNLEQGVLIYETLRPVHQGEELCISYGPKLWFQDADDPSDDDVADESPMNDEGESEGFLQNFAIGL